MGSIQALAVLLLIFTLISPSFVMAEGPTGASASEETSTRYITLRVPAGEFAYLVFNASTGDVTEMPTAIGRGLSEDMESALSMVPPWLRDDLARKFGELYDRDISMDGLGDAAFGDMDDDGDVDMFAGGPDLLYYENVGTIFEPVWKEPIDIWETETGLSPAVGDVDGDGDLDLVYGCSDGGVYLCENEGTADSMALAGALPMKSSGGNDIDVGSYSDPALADMDGDGDPDLTIGSQSSNLAYYRNDGGTWVRESAMFVGADITGYTTPALADLDGDGEMELVLGCEDGTLHFYEDVGAVGHEWVEDSSIFGTGERPVRVNGNSDPALGDVNGDLCYDLYVGDDDGHIFCFRNIGTYSEPGYVDLCSGMAFEYDNQHQSGATVGSSVVVPSRRVQARTDLAIAEEYAGLILEAAPELADEIGFSIANTAVQVLKDPDVYPEVFRENAESLYEIDRYLDYADLVERGGPNGSYTTMVYRMNESGERVQYELPPQIYYWYVVHPKITDEIPTYIEPETGDPAPPPTGKFWRTYFFFHADDEYPSDPGGDVHYPKDVGPPLLKEKLEGIEHLWNGTQYIAPRGYDNDGVNNTRPWDLGDHAVERVSNWVEKTLPLRVAEDDDGSRPIQPVRIFHEHNGNCGELQDLSTAAARTAMIPAHGVCDISEDHVWQEFYHEGWRHWDNWWSDGGSIFDWAEYYEEHWMPYISCVWSHRGDDSIDNMNYQGYTETARIEVRLEDRNGDPVDGGIVLAGSHRMAENINPAHTAFTPPPIPSLWNYTDEDGVAVLELGTNNYTLNIWSPLGTVPDQQITVVEGNDQTLTYQLDGRKRTWSPDGAPIGSMSGTTELDLRFAVIHGLQDNVNLLEGVRHDAEIQDETITAFVMDRESFDTFRRGGAPEDLGTAYEPNIDVTSGEISFSADSGEWYVVFLNTEVIKTDKVVLVSIPTYVTAEDPEVTITSPRDGKSFHLGAAVLIEGTATDNVGIERLLLYIDGDDIDITDRIIDGEWEYIWNTTGLTKGKYSISVTATDGSGNTDTAKVTVYIGTSSSEDEVIDDIQMAAMIIVVVVVLTLLALWKRSG